MMIGQVHGKLVYKQPPRLLVDVAGIGYELEAPMTTFYNLPETGTEVCLHTHVVVRDDAHLLYGFTEQRQRDVFRHLLKVNGVGPRVALAILSGLTVEDLVACVSAADAAMLTRVPGIGRKTAERLIVDLRDRLDGIEGSGSSFVGTRPLTPEHDAVSALVALGYRQTDAARAIRATASDDAGVEELIRTALASLSGART
jgi:Holliday junction DNA helicase RuvA